LFLYLAPLRGITDYTFRTVYAAHFPGFDCAVAPFISSVKGKTIKRSHIRDIVPENNARLPVVPQIIGNNPNEFIVLANMMSDLGYSMVNWNIGCPFPQVTAKKRGAGLLPFPEKIRYFLERVIPRIHSRLSIKTRIGLTDAREMDAVLPIFNAFPLAEIIVHPRTGRQMYSGSIDLECFERFLAGSAHTVVYNGDITTFDAFMKISRRFPNINRWMIGRGALFNPFLAQSLRCAVTGPATMGPRIQRFHDELFAAYRDCMKNTGNAIDKMKGVWWYLAHAMPNGTLLLKRIQKTRRLDHYEEIVAKAFNDG